MSQMTLVNNSAAAVVSTGNITTPPYKARFYISYWGVQFADVEVDKTEETTVDSPSLAATLTATGVPPGSPTLNVGDPGEATVQGGGTTSGSSGISSDPVFQSVGYGIKDVTTVQNIGVSVVNGQLHMASGAGPTTPDMLTMTNQCSFTVTFQLTVQGGAAAQSWQVAPKESASVNVGEVFTAYARVNGYAYQPIGSDGYDTPTVSFSSPAARLTVAANNSKGEAYHLSVS
jgi:hypothetical protein